jgi:hypothetical protein
MWRALRLYPLRWSQRRYWDWVDRLAVAVIVSWGAAGTVGGVAIGRAIVPPISAWLSVGLDVVIAALSVLLGLWLIGYVAYAVDQQLALEEREAHRWAFPVTMSERRLGVTLISYFLLLLPVVVVGEIIKSAIPLFWRTVGGIGIEACNVLLFGSLLVLFAQGIRRYPVVLRTWPYRVMYAVIAIWLLIELYSTLSPLTQGLLPPFSKIIPDYELVSQIAAAALVIAFLSAGFRYARDQQREHENGDT